MSDYIAYHSTEVMGYDYEPSGEFAHLSRKPLSFLQTAIGGRVWVVTGQREDGRTIYRLAASYIPSEIRSDAEDYVIRGERGVYFTPPIEIGEHEWFSRLRREQNRFSFGFSRIRDEGVVTELQRILDEYERTHVA